MTAVCPPVSIIIPVYNSVRYLEDCLNSVVNQTYQQIEIILVNDGSTDGSLQIMKSFAAKDGRIVILSQPNRGVSAARNAGLRTAKGDYILFVDSDDTVRNDTVKVLCRQAVATGAEIVIGNVYFCSPDGRQASLFRRVAAYAGQSVMTGEQCFSQFMEASIFPPLVFLYFTKRSFILDNQLFFEEGIVHEDELWCIRTLIQAPQVSVADFFHYFYHERKGSIMHSDDNKTYRIASFFAVVKALETFATQLQEKQEFVQTIGWVYVRIFYIYHFMCRLMQEIKKETNEYRDYFVQMMQKIFPSISGLQRQACVHYFRNGNRLFIKHTAELTLSFCITCKNRLHQIRQTLPRNLEDNMAYKDVTEFVLVDFGSTDGLQEWVAENFTKEIEDGYLKYYYTEELPSWHTSIAKNTSHILANNHIVVNLDCDNFTGRNGGLFVIESMLKYGWDKTVLHQFGNEYNDGTHGRISLSRSNFLMLGGYDESFEPAGYQDNDFLLRAQLSGLHYIHLPDMEYNRAIANTHEEEIAFTDSKLSWDEMDKRNRQMSLKNITSGKLKANTEKEHIGIIDNIYTFQ